MIPGTYDARVLRNFMVQPSMSPNSSWIADQPTSSVLRLFTCLKVKEFRVQDFWVICRPIRGREIR